MRWIYIYIYISEGLSPPTAAASVYAVMEMRIGRKKKQKEEGCMGLVDIVLKFP